MTTNKMNPLIIFSLVALIMLLAALLVVMA